MKLLNDLHYLPMSRIVLPLCIILPPPLGNRLMIYTIYPCPYRFAPLYHLAPLYHFAPLSFCPPPLEIVK